MSIIESLSLFILPPVTTQPLLDGYTDPWLLLLAGLATFIVTTLAFLNRPLQQQKIGVLEASPTPVNAFTLSIGMAIMAMANVVSSTSYQGLGFHPGFVAIPLVITFALNFFALRMVAFEGNPPVKIFIASTLVSVALLLQTLFAFASINKVAIVEFDAALFSLTVGGIALLVTLAVWTRFSDKKRASWERNVSGALISGLSIALALLLSALMTRNSLMLTLQPARESDFFFAAHDVLLTLIYAFVFTVAFSQLANGLLRMRVRNQELLEGESKLNLILHTSTEAIVAIDAKGTITFFNRAAEEMFGWEASEAMGKNVRILVTDEHQHRHDMYIHNYIERRATSVVDTVREVTGKRKDGTYLPVRLSIGHHDNSGEHEFVGIISDISEQRSMAWALRENAKQYRSLVANLPCMAFREMTGATRHIVYISEAAKFMTGYSASVLTGENGVSHFTDRIHKADTSQYRQVREVASRRNGRYDCEYRFMTRDDEQKWFWGNRPYLPGGGWQYLDRRHHSGYHRKTGSRRGSGGENTPGRKGLPVKSLFPCQHELRIPLAHELDSWPDRSADQR